MKLLISLAFFIITTQINFAQIVNFNFNTSPYLTVSSKDANISVSDISLSSGTIETNVSTDDYFIDEPYIQESGNWDDASQATAKYFTFSISATSGYQFSISSISFDAYATGAGPTAFGSEIDGTSLTEIDAPEGIVITYNNSISKTGLSTAVIKIQGWLNGFRVSSGNGIFKLDNISIFGSVTEVSTPFINVIPNSLSDLNYIVGDGPSSEKSFTVNGSNLTNNISITPPTNYEISLTSDASFSSTNPITLIQSNGAVGLTTVYVRLKAGLLLGNYFDEITVLTSDGAPDQSITLSGSAINDAPNLIITEIMKNPDAVTDAAGDWFEIYNPNNTVVDIDGYRIKDTGSESHTINNGSALNIPAKGFIVLGVNSNSESNGELTIDYQFNSFTLGNDADEIILLFSDGITEIDRVFYDENNFPDPTGASLYLTNFTLDNNVGLNWAVSTVREGTYTGTSTDFGSPGALGTEAALPVELTSFSASSQNNSVILSWETATEVNNYGFEVERQILTRQPDNSNWSKVGFIEGNGNSSSPKQYSHVDNNLNSGSYSYRLKQIDFDGMFEFSKVISVQINSPVKYELSQNFPNPFNPSTVIEYSIPNNDYVSLKVYDILGNEVANLVNENKEAGTYKVNFDASNLPGANSSLTSGIYFYSIKTSSFNQVRKMMLVK